MNNDDADSLDEAQAQADLDRLNKAIASLTPHFDTIQVFASRHIGHAEGTFIVHSGAGNWYARYGQVRQWVVQQEHPPAGE